MLAGMSRRNWTEVEAMIPMKELPIEGCPAEAVSEVLWDSSVTCAFLNIPSEDYSDELEGELLAVFLRECAAGVT
jgi:hypothetical protein